MKKLEADRKLYIAVSHIAYDNVFQSQAVQMLIKENNVSLVVVDVVTEEVVQWIQN